jgi:hypothetical protein
LGLSALMTRSFFVPKTLPSSLLINRKSFRGQSTRTLSLEA